jgi:hypothetical protein
MTQADIDFLDDVYKWQIERLTALSATAALHRLHDAVALMGGLVHELSALRALMKNLSDAAATSPGDLENAIKALVAVRGEMHDQREYLDRVPGPAAQCAKQAIAAQISAFTALVIIFDNQRRSLVPDPTKPAATTSAPWRHFRNMADRRTG